MSKEWKRLGALIPPVNVTVEREFNRWAPEGVSIHTQRLWRRRATLSSEDLKEMLTHLEEDCRLLAFAQPHFVTYACTSGSSLETGGFDEKIARRIAQAAGCPASTTATAVVEALRCLKVRRVAVATPYPQEVNEKEMAFFVDLGLEPVSLETFLLSDSYRIPVVPQEETLALAKKADRPDAEGIFISCTNLPTADIIERLEQEVGKPVVTSNQATFWQALRRMGVDEAVPHCGRLLSQPALSPSSVV